MYKYAPIRKDSVVLDIGTGTGFLAIDAVLHGASYVEALDNDSRAVECARNNVRINTSGRKIAVFQSDLFEKVIPGKRFDLIYSNLPYLDRNEDYGFPSLFDPGFKSHETFFKKAPEHLRDGGSIRMSHANLDKDGFEKLEKLAYDSELNFRILNSLIFENYDWRLYELFPR